MLLFSVSPRCMIEVALSKRCQLHPTEIKGSYLHSCRTERSQVVWILVIMTLRAVVKDLFGIIWRGITDAASSAEMRGPRYYD